MTEQVSKCILQPSDATNWSPPLDVPDLVVRLEAGGITNSLSNEKYGFTDVWNMAASYFPTARAQKAICLLKTARVPYAKSYLKGLAFALPLISCCLMVLLLNVSLWGGSLTGNEAAAIAIATCSAFVISGAFLQLIGRQGHHYKELREWKLCAKASWLFVRWGFLALLICDSIFLIGNLYFGWLPWGLFFLCATFTVAIGAYLLISGVLYVLHSELIVAAGTLIGTFVVMGLNVKLHIPLLVSQTAGISTATSVCLLFAFLRFRHLGGSSGILSKLPPLSRQLYLLWPYFVYGALYYSFLFMDRMIAWSAHTQGESLPLQFRGAYETALDICLLAFILQVGWVHPGLVRFYEVVSAEQKRFRLSERHELQKRLIKFYGRQLLWIGFLAVVSSAIVYIVIGRFPMVRSILIPRVAYLALLGTPMLVVGLWNISLLFALSRPQLVLVSVGWGLAFDICCGYLLSRVFSYDFAILGFDLGACALAIISTSLFRRLLADFDYHFFAAAV